MQSSRRDMNALLAGKHGKIITPQERWCVCTGLAYIVHSPFPHLPF